MRRFDWRQVVVGLVVGIVLGGIGAWYNQGQRNAALQERVVALQEQVRDLKAEVRELPTRPYSPEAAAPERETAEAAGRLVDIITEQQHRDVKQSYGELASQCFTDKDLEAFMRHGTAAKAAEVLKRDNRFIETVLAIKRLSPADRQDLLNTCSQLARPTWAELGRISSEGQTDAGHKAELMIATSIVNQVRELCALPADEIEQLYVD